MKKAIKQLITKYEDEIVELKKIQSRQAKNSFFWSMAEGAKGECEMIVSDLKVL